MPTYDYDCQACGTFSALKRISARDEPTHCPACDQLATRRVSAPQLGFMEGDVRRASERTAAEGGYPRMRHAAGCGCC